MKTYLPYSLIFAAAASGMAFGAVTAYTTPVGYVSLGKATGAAVPANTDVHVSLTLDRPTVFAGLIASVTGVGSNTINLQGTPALGSLTTIPHVVKVTSGVGLGFYALVIANSATSVTVSLPPGQSLSGVLSGDKLQISSAWTATNLFTGTPIPADTEFYVYGGATAGINHAPSTLLVWDGTAWLDQSSGSPSNPVIYPGEALVVRALSMPIPTFVVSGQVPTAGFTNVLTHFGAANQAQDLEYAVNSPINQTLAQTGLLAVARDSDELYLYDNSGSGLNQAPSALYAYDAAAGGYLDQGTGNPILPSTILQSGTTLVIRRAPNINPAPVTANWTFVPNYTIQ